jgi:hypothetical protein
VNPLASHWVRIALGLLLVSPVVAVLVTVSSDAGFTFALVVTLYIWLLVCVILALIALGGLFVRLVGWGIRAIRR